MKYTAYLVLKKKKPDERGTGGFTIFTNVTSSLKIYLRDLRLICGIQTIRNRACHGGWRKN